MSARSRPRPLVAAATAVLLAACSNAAAPKPTAPVTPTPNPVPPGWTLVVDAKAKFSIGLPPGWEHALLDAPTLQQDVADITKRHAETGDYITTALNKKDKELQLIGVDPASAPDLFLTNYNVLRADLGDSSHAPDLDLSARAKTAQLTGQSDVGGPPKSRALKVSGLPGMRFDYTLKISDKTTAQVTTYLVLRDIGSHRFRFELTLGTANPAGVNSTFDQVIKTFTILA